MKRVKALWLIGLALACACAFALAGCSGEGGVRVELDPSSVASGYEVGAEVDCTAMRLKVVRSGNTEIIPVTADMVREAPSTSSPGKSPLKLRFGNRDYTFYINVWEPLPPLSVTTRSISVSDGSPTVVTVDTRVPQGLAVNAYQTDGTARKVSVTSSMLEGYAAYYQEMDRRAEIVLDGARCSYTYSVARRRSASADFLTEDIKDSKGAVTGKAVIGLADVSDIAVSAVIPANISGYPVTVRRLNSNNLLRVDASKAAAVEEGAFSGASQLREAVLPEKLTALPARCFENCARLASIDLANVTEFGSRALRGTALEYVRLSAAKVKKIGASAFDANTRIIVPAGDAAKFQELAPEAKVTSEAYVSGSTVFEETEEGVRIVDYLARDAEVSVPAELAGKPVTEVAANAYARNTELSRLELAHTVTRVAEGAFPTAKLRDVFLNNASQVSYASVFGNAEVFVCGQNERGMLFGEFLIHQAANGNEVVRYLGNEKSVTVPASVNGVQIVSIAQGAFAENLALEEVAFSEGLKAISANAFQDCKYLRTVSFPESLTYVGAYAFSGCFNLTGSFRAGKNLRNVGAYAFEGCVRLERIEMCPDEALSGVSVFAQNAFQNCSGIREVKVWGAYALSSYLNTNSGSALSGLTVTVLPGSKFVADHFADGLPVSKLSLPDGVTRIGQYAFRGGNLSALTVPASVTTIGYGAFQANYNLITPVFEGNKVTALSGAFTADAVSYALCPAGNTSAALNAAGIDNYVRTYERDGLRFGAYYNEGEACEALLGMKETKSTLTLSVRRIGKNALTKTVTNLTLTDDVREVRANNLYRPGLKTLTAPVDVLNGIVVTCPLFTWQSGTVPTLTLNKLTVTNGREEEYGARLSLAGVKAETVELGDTVAASDFTDTNDVLKTLKLNGRNAASLYAGASKLTGLTLTGELRSFSANNFTALSKLRSVTIDAEGSDYVSEGGVVYYEYIANGKTLRDLALCPQTKTGVLTVPENVVKVRSYALYRTSLSEIKVQKRRPENEIPAFAFETDAVVSPVQAKFLARYEEASAKTGTSGILEVGPDEAVIWLHYQQTDVLLYVLIDRGTSYDAAGWYTDANRTKQFAPGTVVEADLDLYRYE